MSIETEWSHACAEIPADGKELTRTASAEDLSQLSDTLGILALERLEARYRLTALAHGRFRLEGEIRAKVSQACVVTLEPVASDIVEPLAVEFWPAADIPAVSDTEQDALAIEEREPIEQQRLAVGRVVFETLAAALNPYPRKPGAKFDWEDATPAGSPASSPFAALAKLKSGKE